MKRLIRKFTSYLSNRVGNPLKKGKNGPFVFIHINKTGGTSILDVIGSNKNHLTVQEVISIIGEEKFRNAFSFSVVRNPWSKVVSHYNHRIKTNQTDMKSNPISFKDWVKCTYGPKKDAFYFDNYKMFQPQVEWLKDHKGEIGVDKVLRFESLENEFREVAKIIGISGDLPHLNSSRKTRYTDYYEPETIEIVRSWFMEDIEMFQYEFDQN